VTRVWNSVAGAPIDMYGVFGFVVVMFVVCGLVGAAWHFFPGWLPRASWFRWLRRVRHPRGAFGWPRRRKRARRVRRGPAPQAAPEVIDAQVLPDLPASEFRSRADAFAAAGQFAAAVRERLRAMVRDLVDAGVVDMHPEWTVTELARSAAAAAPRLEPALAGAGGLFSDIWYGERPANAGDDVRMRGYDEQVGAIVRERRAGVAR
jgi:hypothetical protein